MCSLNAFAWSVGYARNNKTVPKTLAPVRTHEMTLKS